MRPRSPYLPVRAAALVWLVFMSNLSWGGRGDGVDYDARLLGKVGDVTRAESIWIGAIEVRFRTPFVFDEQRDKALDFLRGLAFPNREVECRLTGERLGPPGSGVMIGDCIVFGPTDGREINLGDRLIERGFARPCVAPQAVIAIWPPVFDCQ